MKKEGGLSRSDTLKPEVPSEPSSEQESGHGSVVMEEPKPDESSKQAELQQDEDEEAEEEAEITVIESEVPEDAEGPGESAAEKPAEEVKAEAITES